MKRQSTLTNKETSFKKFYTNNKTVVGIVVALTILAVGYIVTQALSASEQKVTATHTPAVVTAQDTAISSPTVDNNIITSPSEVPQLSSGNQAQAPTPTADWEPVAQGFGEAWANTEGGRDAWLQRIRPYVNDAMYQGFEYTDFERYVTDRQMERVELDGTGDSRYDIRANIFYVGDDPQKPSVTIWLSPTGENLQYQVVSVQ